MDAAIDAFVAGPSQALIRGAGGTAWLKFS
jgi:hypothetical protein